MAALPTIPEYVDLGDATIFLMANDQARGSLFGARLVQQTSPVMVGIVTDALRWQNDKMPSDSTLRGVGEYLYWLCGKYQLQARNLTGGGSVTPLPPGLSSLNPLSFVVSGTSPIITGGNTITLDSGQYDYRGYNLLFTRNNIPQSITDNGGTWYQWSKVTGVFTCIGATTAGELFDLTPTI